MKTENVELMRMARMSLTGKWALAVGTFAAYYVFSIVIGQIPYIAGLFPFIIGGPMSVGLSVFSLSIARNEEAEFEQIFKGFDNFVRSWITYFLMGIFTVLWLLCLIIPGIIAIYSYAMTFYILADDAAITPMAAIDKSKLIMDGYKMKLFFLHLRFFGWILLSFLTLGIGLFWVIPYMQVSSAKFYDDLIGTKYEDEIDQIGNYLPA